MRYLRFLVLAALSGGIWYLVLSLPISPISYEFMVKNSDWPSLTMIGSLSLASILAAIPLARLFRSNRSEIVTLGGIAFTFLSGILFALIIFVLSVLHGLWSGESVYPLYGQMPGPELLVEALPMAMYGFVYALFSAHVAIPTGVGLAFLFRRALQITTSVPHP